MLRETMTELTKYLAKGASEKIRLYACSVAGSGSALSGSKTSSGRLNDELSVHSHGMAMARLKTTSAV